MLDATPPNLILPSNLTTQASGLDTSISDIGQATATDDVSDAANITITNNAPATYPLGTTGVVWTATDEAGNVATATQNITVVDTTAPTVIAPEDITIEAEGLLTSINIGTADGTDALGSVVISNNAPASFPVGQTIVTWTGTDSSNNVGTSTQFITVTDNTPPELTIPGDISVEATSSLTTVAIGTAAASDFVDGTVSVSNNAPAAFPVGSTTVTWTAKDLSDNTSTATQTVIIVDTIAPAITAPVDVTVDATGPLTAVALIDPAAIDAVGVASLTSDAPVGFPVDSTTTVTWTAIDETGNSSSAIQTVTIKPFLLSLNIEKAKVKLHKKDPNKDKIKIKGHYVEFANGDGLNIKEAIVTVNGVSLSKVKFKKNGKFEVTGKRLNLRGIDFTAPVALSIRIGNDLGGQSILFDKKGKFDGGDKDKDKDKDDDRKKNRGKRK